LRRNGNGAEELGQNPELLLGNEDEITEAGILAKTAEAATVAAAAATAAKIMAVQWKRWIRTGAAWAVQVAGYTPRTGKRRRGIKRAITGNGGGRVAKDSQGHRA